MRLCGRAKRLQRDETNTYAATLQRGGGFTAKNGLAAPNQSNL
jgi:hypothetical protein